MLPRDDDGNEKQQDKPIEQVKYYEWNEEMTQKARDIIEADG